MKNKFIAIYATFAFLALAGSVAWFFMSLSSASKTGYNEAERSFDWISRESGSAALQNGFMSDDFVARMTEICGQSRLLSSLVLSTPAGALFVWPADSYLFTYTMNGSVSFTDTPLFSRTFSAVVDVGDGFSGAVTLTALVQGLESQYIFYSLRNSFFIVFAVFLLTLIVILLQSTKLEHKKSTDKSVDAILDEAFSAKKEPLLRPSPFEGKTEIETAETPRDSSEAAIVDSSPDEVSSYMDDEPSPSSFQSSDVPYAEDGELESVPEGLFSPLTGIGWEEYLLDRLDAELVRAASSEQDLSLIIVQVDPLSRTDLLAKKISQVLLDTFRFRDMVFEFGSNGFAGILINMNLDQAMKTADSLYADIDSILLEMGYSAHIHIGITTRTARLLPASRMIDEALNAAKKAAEEPHLPIVAFRANPEKYRTFVAGAN